MFYTRPAVFAESRPTGHRLGSWCSRYWRRVAQEVRIADEERRAHALEHQRAGDHHSEAGEDEGKVIEAVAERILPGLGPWCVVSELAHDLGFELRDVFRSHPDRPEVEEERRMHDVEEDRRGQDEARHPVPLHPRKFHTGDRQERREQQHEHGRGHHPVEETRGEAVALDLRRQILARRLERVGFRLGALSVGGEQHVARVRDEKQDAREQRGPEQVPRDVRENPLAPRTPSVP
jgi:hypothetical protein